VRQDNSSELFTLLILFSLLVYVLYIVISPYLLHALVYLNYYEAKGVLSVYEFLDFESEELVAQVNNSAELFNAGVSGYIPSLVPQIRQGINYYFLGVLALPIVVKTVLDFIGNESYTGWLTHDQLDAYRAMKYYPIRPVVCRELHKQSALTGEWRYSMKPWSFAAEHQILVQENNQAITLVYKKNSVLPEKPSEQEIAHFKFCDDVAHGVFIKQLGQKLNQVEEILSLKPSEKALIVALISDLCPDIAMKEKDQWLEQFANSFYEPKKVQKKLKKGIDPDFVPFTESNIDISGVNEQLKMALKHDESRKRLQASKYTNCLIAKLMSEALRVHTALFVWLKPINRTLFYTLNNVGRARRYHIEGHAAFCHLEVEKELNRPIAYPNVGGSVLGLKRELLRHRWVT